jgi:mannose-6-phosphate isomerase-like protein (cupin superfamily)
MNCGYHGRQADYGPEPYVADIAWLAAQNQNFRQAIWTGQHLQMTLMSIPVRGEIGLEMHQDTDQLIRVEQGTAVVTLGKCKCNPDMQQNMNEGDAVFVPAGTWHNITNSGRTPLKVSSVYAPPNHPRGTVHRTKADAEEAERY